MCGWSSIKFVYKLKQKPKQIINRFLPFIKQQIPTTFINQLAINFYDHQPFFHVCADVHYDCRCSNFPYHHRWMAMAMTVAVWLLMVININNGFLKWTTSIITTTTCIFKWWSNWIKGWIRFKRWKRFESSPFDQPSNIVIRWIARRDSISRDIIKWASVLNPPGFWNDWIQILYILDL